MVDSLNFVLKKVKEDIPSTVLKIIGRQKEGGNFTLLFSFLENF